MGLGTLTLMGVLWAPGQAAPANSLPFNPAKIDLYWKEAKLDIPIRYEASRKDQIRDLLLFVSHNHGKSWEQFAAGKPDSDQFFAFKAPEDGVYWFQMMIVDKQGRQDPPRFDERTIPAFAVMFDTRSPLASIKSVDRVNDEATVVWEIQEANPDWNKFRLEYRVGDSYWTPVEAQPGPSGSARFRITQPGVVTVRLQAYDLAGNRSEATKDLVEPAKVIGSNVGTTPSFQQSSMRIPAPAETPPPAVGVTPPSDPAPVLVSESPMGVVKTDRAIFGVPAVSPGAPVVTPPVEPVFKNDSQTPPSAPASPLAVSPSTPRPPSGVPLPPAQVINVARFDVAYDVEQKGPSGVSKAEVWVTRDDGRSWQRWSTTEKTDSPVTVDLASKNNPQIEGTYGIKIVLLSGAGLSNGPPLSGEAPEMRVDVDLTPPVVKIYEPIPDPNQKDTMILRWQANDRNLASDPITLEWSEQAEGPWNPIVSSDGNSGAIGSSAAATVKRLANNGQYSWKLPANFPTHRVYVRVTARDTAGNIGDVRSPHPILVDMNKPVAKIHGIIGAPAPDRR